MKLIAIVGSSNIDIVLVVDRFTKPGETQKVSEMKIIPGGKGANQAVTVAKLGRTGCFFVTCLGDDEYGKMLSENFKNLGIKGYIITNGPTGRAFIEVTKSGQNRIMIFSGANDMLSPELINWEELFKNRFLLLQNEIPIGTTFEIARRFPGTVIFDPAPAQGIGKEIFEYVDYLTPNEEEIRMLSKNIFGRTMTIEESAKKFLELGVKNVLVKMGKKGSVLFTKNKVIHIPAFKVKVVDTTAAGDVFNGAFAVALSEGKDVESAIRFANAAAAISVTRIGAQTSIPTREEVEEFLKERV